MDTITLRLPPETIETVEAEAAEHGVSRSEYLRDAIASRGDHDATRAGYEEEIEELEQEIDRLRGELRATNARQEDIGELVEYVEDERELQRRERERRNAPAWRRAKWWLFGRSENNVES